MPYDSKNLTDEQYLALIAFATPIAMALASGIPPDDIRKHVNEVLTCDEVVTAADKLKVEQVMRQAAKPSR